MYTITNRQSTVRTAEGIENVNWLDYRKPVLVKKRFVMLTKGLLSSVSVSAGNDPALHIRVATKRCERCPRQVYSDKTERKRKTKASAGSRFARCQAKIIAS